MIGSKLTAANILVTDAWRAYKTYASEKGLEHYRLKANGGTHVIKGIYHNPKRECVAFSLKELDSSV